MTNTPNKTLLAAIALAALTLGAVARADDFGGQTAGDGSNAYYAYLDQQAANSQFADPTARGSLRSHGNP